jgi:hypothetical protein
MFAGIPAAVRDVLVVVVPPGVPIAVPVGVNMAINAL